MSGILLNIKGTVRKIIAVTVIAEVMILIARALSGRDSDLRWLFTFAAVMLPVLAIILLLRGGISLPKTVLLILASLPLYTLGFTAIAFLAYPKEFTELGVWSMLLFPFVFTFISLFIFFRIRKIKVNPLLLLLLALVSAMSCFLIILAVAFYTGVT